MKLIFVLSALLGNSLLFAQTLNWNTVSYTTGSLSTNFGTIGSPATAVSLNITGSTAQINGSFPIKYIANPPGTANDCSVNCALRSSITYTTLAQSTIYTFTFSPAVTGLSFNLYDIDGDNTNGDQAVVTASGSSAQNITMTSLDVGGPTVTGSGTTAATVRGTQGNTTDQRVGVSIVGGVTSLIITYSNNLSGSAGNRSFSIGNMNWSGTLPVKFLSFIGRKIATNSVLLKWKTENEVNLSKYEIERSTDGVNFINTGVVNAGTSNNDYSYIDNVSTQGTLFYRIKEIDLDNRFEYSSVIALRFDNDVKPGITIFPNPASQSIFITTKNNSEIQLTKIFDSNGKTVLRKEGTENNIDISRLPSGLYRVIVIDKNGDSSSSSFLKK